MLCLAWPGPFVLKSIQCSVQRRWFCSFGISESFLLTADSWNWRGSWRQVRSLHSRVSHWNLSRFRAVKSSHTHKKVVSFLFSNALCTILASKVVYQLSACWSLDVPANCPDDLFYFEFPWCSFQVTVARLICWLWFEVTKKLVLEKDGERKKKPPRFNCLRQTAEEAGCCQRSLAARLTPLIGEAESCAAI